MFFSALDEQNAQTIEQRKGIKGTITSPQSPDPVSPGPTPSTSSFPFQIPTITTETIPAIPEIIGPDDEVAAALQSPKSVEAGNLLQVPTFTFTGTEGERPGGRMVSVSPSPSPPPLGTRMGKSRLIILSYFFV